MNTISQQITSLIAAVVLPIICILVLIGIAISSLPLYSLVVRDNDSLVHFSDTYIMTVSMTKFLFDVGPLPQSLTLKEQLHLVDIQKIITTGKVVLTLSLLLALAAGIHGYKYRSFKQWVSNGLLVSSICCFILMIVFVFFFQWLFITFHEVSFDNLFWQLNPTTDILIVLFPPEFFLSLGFFIGISNIILSVLLAHFIRHSQ